MNRRCILNFQCQLKQMIILNMHELSTPIFENGRFLVVSQGIASPPLLLTRLLKSLDPLKRKLSKKKDPGSHLNHAPEKCQSKKKEKIALHRALAETFLIKNGRNEDAISSELSPPAGTSVQPLQTFFRMKKTNWPGDAFFSACFASEIMLI